MSVLYYTSHYFIKMFLCNTPYYSAGIHALMFSLSQKHSLASLLHPNYVCGESLRRLKISDVNICASFKPFVWFIPPGSASLQRPCSKSDYIHLLKPSLLLLVEHATCLIEEDMKSKSKWKRDGVGGRNWEWLEMGTYFLGKLRFASIVCVCLNNTRTKLHLHSENRMAHTARSH